VAGKLMKYYEYISEQSGLAGKIKLAQITKLPSTPGRHGAGHAGSACPVPGGGEAAHRQTRAQLLTGAAITRCQPRKRSRFFRERERCTRSKILTMGSASVSTAT